MLLEGPTSAVHAGIYVAAQRGFDKGEGLTLRIQRHRPTARPAAQLESERTDAALMPLEDFAQARSAGADIVAVMAITQTPRLAVLASPPLKRPRQLTGRQVGVPPGRAPRALLETMVRHDGGDLSSMRTTLVRPPRAVDALERRRVQAILARRDAVVSEFERAGRQVSVMLPEDYGVPDHPGLVVVVNQTTLDDRPGAIRSLARTLQRGYNAAQVDPESAVGAMLERQPRLDRNALLAGIDSVTSSWTAGVAAFGQLRSSELARWQEWALRNKILRQPLPRSAFATDWVQPLRNP